MRQSADSIESVPKSLGTYALLFFLGILCISGLECANYYLPTILKTLKLLSFPALDLARQDNALNWLTSAFLLAGAYFAWINFRLCCRFSDPFVLRQCWLGLTGLLLLLSIDIQTGLHITIRNLLIPVCGTVYQNGDVLYLAAYGIVFGFAVLRILFSAMRLSIGTFVLVIFAVGGIVLQYLLQFNLVQLPPQIPAGQAAIIQPILLTSLLPLSALLVFVALGLFARRQTFRDPEVALHWFAKVWNYSPQLNQFLAKTKADTAVKTDDLFDLNTPKAPILNSKNNTKVTDLNVDVKTTLQPRPVIEPKKK